jgi:hypothetical protein
MTSGTKEKYLAEQEQKKEEQREWLKKLADRIIKIEPGSVEYMDLRYMMRNKEKIVRNKKLINLIG